MQDLLKMVQEMDESKRGELLFASSSFSLKEGETLRTVPAQLKKTATMLIKKINEQSRTVVPKAVSRGSTWRVGLITLKGVTFEYSMRARRNDNSILVQLGYYYEK